MTRRPMQMISIPNNNYHEKAKISLVANFNLVPKQDIMAITLCDRTYC